MGLSPLRGPNDRSVNTITIMSLVIIEVHFDDLWGIIRVNRSDIRTIVSEA